MSGTLASGLPGSAGGNTRRDPDRDPNLRPTPPQMGRNQAPQGPTATPGGPTLEGAEQDKGLGSPIPEKCEVGAVRVNLLPAEFQLRIVLARARRRAATIVAVAVVLVILVTLFSFLQVGRAQSELDEAQTAQAAAQTEVSKYSEVPRVAAQLAELKTQLTEALGSEVLFSSMMSNVAGVLPAGVSLTSLGFTLPTSSSTSKNASGKKTSGTTGDTTEDSGIGDVTFSGTAPSLDAVSSFLERLEADKQFEHVTLTSATLESTSSGTSTTKTTTSTQPKYTFEGTAQLSKSALSNRYAQEAAQGSGSQ